MVTFGDELIDQVRQGLCNTTNTAAATAALGSRLWGSVGFTTGQVASQRAAQFWGNASGVFCNRPPSDAGGEVNGPFVGGQCPGVAYRVRAQSALNGVPFGSVQQGTGPGPLESINQPNPSGNGNQIAIRDANGDDLVSAGTSFPDNEVSWVFVDVERLDGQPDDCGNPPASGPQYNETDFTFPTTINYDDDGGNPQSQPVDIVYKPTTINERGDFIVPVEINFGDNNSLFGDLNISTGDFNFGGGNSGGDGIQPEPRELTEGEDPPEGTSIIGVRVISSVSSIKEAGVTELFSSQPGENLFVPRLGSVLFTYEESSGSGPGETQDYKTLNSVVYAAKPCSGVRLFVRRGVVSTTRLIVVPDATLCCPN